MSDELTRALKALARDDERTAGIPMSPHLRQELAQRCRAASVFSRRLGYALAAALLAGLVWPTWLATTHMSTTGISSRPASREIVTSFLPLTYGPLPMTDGRIVRIELPRRSLAALGLLSDDQVSKGPDTVLADVVVGEDGLARAVRFVRTTPASD
jgi:hypothetical protein